MIGSFSGVIIVAISKVVTQPVAVVDPDTGVIPIDT
jgi:hypothetical protein